MEDLTTLNLREENRILKEEYVQLAEKYEAVKKELNLITANYNAMWKHGAEQDAASPAPPKHPDQIPDKHDKNSDHG